MTFLELKDALTQMNQSDPFVTRTGINGSVKSRHTIDETYVHVSFSDNYTGGVRNIKINPNGDIAILDGSFNPNSNVNVDVEALWVACNEAIMSGIGDAELGYYIPSAGYFPVVDIDHKKGNWGDGDGTYDYVDFICTKEPLDIGEAVAPEWESLITSNLRESTKKVNEAVEDYIHPTLKACAEYVPTVYYACYTLDNKGNEEDHFEDFDLFEDAVSACKQKTNESHQSTHICVVITDRYTDESYAFERSYGLSNYEVVAEFSPDPGEALIEKSFSWYKRRNKFMSSGRRNK